MRPGNMQTFGEMHGGDKSEYEPSPAAAAIEAPSYQTIDLAEGITYQQDRRCKEGEKVSMVACSGPGCDPGEQGAECVDDPEYAKLAAQVAEMEAVEAQIREEEALQRAQEEQVYQAGRAERSAQRAAMMDQSMALNLEEESPVVMYAVIGGGALLLLVTTLLMRRKPKPAPASAARKRKRRKR